MSTGTLISLPLKPDEYVQVPSGVKISLRRPDFSLCTSREDFLELRCALMEKIIDIELQIDLFHSGAGVSQGRSYEPDWLPRANAALKWSKLYRDECQQRQSIWNDRQRAERQEPLTQRFVSEAKEYLSPSDFRELQKRAGMFEG